MKGSLRWEENRFRLNKLGYIKVKHKRDINGKIKEVTIMKENGHWFISIVYELDKIESREKFQDFGSYVGIDVGITDFLTFSDGKVIAKLDLKRINGRIRHYQRKIAQQKKVDQTGKKHLKNSKIG